MCGKAGTAVENPIQFGEITEKMSPEVRTEKSLMDERAWRLGSFPERAHLGMELEAQA